MCNPRKSRIIMVNYIKKPQRDALPFACRLGRWHRNKRHWKSKCEWCLLLALHLGSWQVFELRILFIQSSGHEGGLSQHKLPHSYVWVCWLLPRYPDDKPLGLWRWGFEVCRSYIPIKLSPDFIMGINVLSKHQSCIIFIYTNITWRWSDYAILGQ